MQRLKWVMPEDCRHRVLPIQAERPVLGDLLFRESAKTTMKLKPGLTCRARVKLPALYQVQIVVQI